MDVVLWNDRLIGTGSLPADSLPVPSPTCLHSPVVSPCCTVAPRGSLSSTQSLVPVQKTCTSTRTWLGYTRRRECGIWLMPRQNRCINELAVIFVMHIVNSCPCPVMRLEELTTTLC